MKLNYFKSSVLTAETTSFSVTGSHCCLTQSMVS